ncbi:hypothetical protein PVK06_047791 [Gossypium arboreum]|uniref:Uncharacterized protein n=1 Tax=Gossypium arboreum TaxID=29729 RepID=A0ABR0MER2_GOSAR|nr:hypothetical protein PVK06_047791 [Gossypium arboreum]
MVSFEVNHCCKVEAGLVDQGADAWLICQYCSRCHHGNCKRMMSAYLVYGSMEHRGSDCPRRAIVVQDQPNIVVPIAPTSARGRDHGGGTNAKGAS